jgi:NIMA (never in mitosis gene a)-related kinase
MAAQHRDVAGILRKRGYTEIRKIGEGSFGKAILVEAADQSRLVCKMIDVSKASAKETQDAVKEGQLLSQFRHPYIVRYKESFIECGWMCIVMDYCQGGELGQKIQETRKARQTLAEEQILRWITQALLALKAIHAKHILHRDLKPGNFFLTKNGNLKMGDFGIAKALGCTIACAKTQIGTPYYLSPEVCKERPYNWASDIWAMGCVLYEMCALKVPFDAPNISALVQKITRGPTPAIPSAYSEFTRQLCAEMLNRDPAARPSADDILQRPRIQAIVRQMLEEAQAAAPPQQPMAPAAPPAAPAAAAAAVLSPTEDAAAAAAPIEVAGPYADAAGKYKIGDLVEYNSRSHKEWLPATIVDVDIKGDIVIDLKPNTRIGREEQARLVRPRRPSMANDMPRSRIVPRAAAYSPVRQRTPSVGRAPSPGRRTPSEGCFLPARENSFNKDLRNEIELLRRRAAAAQPPSPSSQAAPKGAQGLPGLPLFGTPSGTPSGSRASSPIRGRGFSPARPAAGSRCNTPSRGSRSGSHGNPPSPPLSNRPKLPPVPVPGECRPPRSNSAFAVAGAVIAGA